MRAFWPQQPGRLESDIAQPEDPGTLTDAELDRQIRAGWDVSFDLLDDLLSTGGMLPSRHLAGRVMVLLEFLAIASYTLVAHHPGARPAVIGVVSAVTMFVGHLRYWPEFVLEEVAGDLITILGIAVLPVAIGRSVRSSRRTTAELESRNAELVALREKEAQHALAPFSAPVRG